MLLWLHLLGPLLRVYYLVLTQPSVVAKLSKNFLFDIKEKLTRRGQLLATLAAACFANSIEPTSINTRLASEGESDDEREELEIGASRRIREVKIACAVFGQSLVSRDTAFLILRFFLNLSRAYSSKARNYKLVCQDTETDCQMVAIKLNIPVGELIPTLLYVLSASIHLSSHANW